MFTVVAGDGQAEGHAGSPEAAGSLLDVLARKGARRMLTTWRADWTSIGGSVPLSGGSVQGELDDGAGS